MLFIEIPQIHFTFAQCLACTQKSTLLKIDFIQSFKVFFSNWLQLIVVFKQTLKMADIIFHQKFLIIKIFISSETSLIWLQISVAEGKFYLIITQICQYILFIIYSILLFIIQFQFIYTRTNSNIQTVAANIQRLKRGNKN